MSIKKSNQQDSLDTEELAQGQESVSEGEENAQNSLYESATGTIKVTN